MAAVSSVATSLCVYMLQTYSAVILVLAINSFKMKQMVVFFLFCGSRAVACYSGVRRIFQLERFQ